MIPTSWSGAHVYTVGHSPALEWPIRHEGEHLQRMMALVPMVGILEHDLLDIARIVANKLAIEPEPLELVPLVYSVVDIVRPAMESKGLSLRLSIDKHAGFVVADPDRLRQVISNLLSNAVKFTPPGGAVTVVTERRGSEVVVEVTDTGEGISPDFLPHVFDRFRQADGSHRCREGGLGLGLWIARSLVELHGGELHAHSEGAGHGATFTMTLPSRTCS